MEIFAHVVPAPGTPPLIPHQPSNFLSDFRIRQAPSGSRTASGKPASRPRAVAPCLSLHTSAHTHFHSPGWHPRAAISRLPALTQGFCAAPFVSHAVPYTVSLTRGGHSVNTLLKPPHLTRVTRLSFFYWNQPCYPESKWLKHRNTLTLLMV